MGGLESHWKEEDAMAGGEVRPWGVSTGHPSQREGGEEVDDFLPSQRGRVAEVKPLPGELMLSFASFPLQQRGG